MAKWTKLTTSKNALELLDSEQTSKLEDFLNNLHPVKLVDLIEEVQIEKMPDMLKHVTGLDQLANVFIYGNDLLVQNCLELVDEPRLAAVARRMEPDNAANLLRELPRRKQVSILKRLNPQVVKDLKVLLAYDQETAGAIMTPQFLSIEMNCSVELAIKDLRVALKKEEIDPDTNISYLHITDIDGQLLGIISLRELLSSEPNALVKDLITKELIKVSPENRPRRGSSPNF